MKIDHKLPIAILFFMSTMVPAQSQGIEWGKMLGSDKEEYVLNHLVDNDGNIYIPGKTLGDIGGENLGLNVGFLIKLDSSGNKLWSVQFGSEGFDIPLVLKADEKNDIFVAGTTSGDFASLQAGEGDCFVLRMDQKGEIIWKRQFGTDQNDGVRGIDINDTVSDKIFISGIINLPPENAFVRIFSKDGDMLWERIFEAQGFTGGTSGKDIHLDKKGNFTHLGLTKIPLFGPVIGGNDVYAVKMEAKKFLLKK